MFSFDNITFNSIIDPKNNQESHESGGFINLFLALIIPVGLIFLCALYICVSEYISKHLPSQWNTENGSSLHSSFYEGDTSFTLKPKIFFIMGMKQFDFNESKKMKDCCCICIEDYKLNDKIVILTCGHEFHKPCIHPWLRQQVEDNIVPYCPLCKKTQVIDYREKITEMDLEYGLMIEKV